MSKLAVIDLGTSIIKVVVGAISQTGYTILYEEKFISAISQQLPCATNISLEDQNNIIAILAVIKKKLDRCGVRCVVAKATSLLREASNSAEVIANIRLATGIEVEIISSAQESDLTYLGIGSSLKLTNGHGLIVDIGGGSVECIIFNHVQQLWAKGFELGIRRVASQFSYSDPITPAQIDALEDYYRTALVPLFAATEFYKPSKLIGSSGAFRTLLMLYRCRYTGSIAGTMGGIQKMSIKQFLKIYSVILKTSVHIWQEKVPIEPFFLKHIPLSAILVNLIMSRCNLQTIVISDSSLKTGLFIREWHRLKNEKRI